MRQTVGDGPRSPAADDQERPRRRRRGLVRPQRARVALEERRPARPLLQLRGQAAVPAARRSTSASSSRVRRSGRYHRENAQEGFLVIDGRVPADRRGAGAHAEDVGLLPLPRWHRAHHRRRRRGAGDRRRRRRARSRDRWRRRLRGLRARSAARGERRARDDRLRRGVRGDLRGAAAVAVRPVRAGIAARRRLTRQPLDTVCERWPLRQRCSRRDSWLCSQSTVRSAAPRSATSCSRSVTAATR